MNHWLLAAGLYNLLWGAATIALPNATLELLGIVPTPITAAFWQCIGMIVGVYGLGYLIASRNPLRHWPIVLVGLLGKIFGPIGFIQALTQGVLPVQMGWTILTNDLLWWIPFALILKRALQQNRQPLATQPA
ncbi:MAG: alkyl hydroperoxide reductase [Phycisphaerales bacterium]|nr:alkyl hydroperoxide reductase [Phycisphaerales bacterium]